MLMGRCESSVCAKPIRLLRSLNVDVSDVLHSKVAI